MPNHSKIKKLFDHANNVAAEQDPDVRAKILGNLAIKASEDPAFREALRKNPAQVAEQEAANSNVKISAAELKDVGEKAKQLTSRAVPEAAGGEVTQMVFRTIRDIETSFRLTLTLAKILFFSGLGMVIASFILVAVFKDKQSASIFGVGGFLSLVLGTVLNTLDRVRDAAANLVQIQMAYLAYYKILHLLGSAAEETSRDDAIAFSKQLTANVDQIIGSLQSIVRSNKDVKGTAKTITTGQAAEDETHLKNNVKAAGSTRKPIPTDDDRSAHVQNTSS